MLANINECISLNCITPTSSCTTRTASAFRCCLTIICSWAHLKEVRYTVFEFGPCLNPTLVQTVFIQTLKRCPTWYRHWTWIGSVFPWKLNDSNVNLSSPFGPRSRISKVSSRIQPSLMNFHVGKFESYKRFLNFQISHGYLFDLLLYFDYIVEKKTRKPSLLEPYFQWDRVQKCM